MPLTANDLQKVQEQLPDYRMELVGGEIVVRSPSGLELNEVALEIGRQLGNWVRPRKLGRVIGSSGGYFLPNDSEVVRASDASFIRAERLTRPTQDYCKILPDLIFEVKSKSDSLEKLR